jgi:hypothetical protein
MASATFRHGDPLMVDYTPASGNIAAGQVILAGNAAGVSCVIAHRPIVNNTLGAVAAGGGVYDIINLDNAATWAKVYWDPATPTKVTTTSTNNAKFGYVVANGGGGANTTCRCLHDPLIS